MQKRKLTSNMIFGCIKLIKPVSPIDYASEERPAWLVLCMKCGQTYKRCNRNITRRKNDTCSKECKSIQSKNEKLEQVIKCIIKEK